ncbi:hypothetical protein KAR91_23610 [Candidatus Pacearchaeota archaeon]|nr:hypothetical protein [Candidatus Pacearchaeota archaeon]
MTQVVELGVGAIFAISIIKIFVSFVKARKGGIPVVQLNSQIENKLQRMTSQINELKPGLEKSLRQTEELYNMHSVRDVDGTPIWYMKSSLEKAIEKLSDSILTWNTTMVKVSEKLNQNDKDHEKLNDKVDILVNRR